MNASNRSAQVNFESLLRIFTIPEGPDSTLTQIEEKLSGNLNEFLKEHIVAEEKPLGEIEQNFATAQLPEIPEFVSEHTEHLMDNLVAHSVHTAAPSFIGHMTSALPYYLMPLSKIMIALNQNLVKIETSKAFTPLERQVLGMMHNLVYQQDDAFYQKWMHSAQHSLGAFCSGGTIANITALWVARNKLFAPDKGFNGVTQDGMVAALRHYGYNDTAILVSKRGHYSLSKAADVLGIGRKNVIAIETDNNNKLSIEALKSQLKILEQQNIKPLAVVGIAGTTETGNVDPLDQIAKICQQHSIYFHVDAAWGGATLMSSQYRDLLRGIEHADSVTIDAHKQLYIPMGAGLVVFKDPNDMASVEHHAAYILRKGSKDLGAHTLEGSRSGMAMLLYSSMHIISRPGYELLINQSIEKAHYFAKLIDDHPDFELVTRPELCLLTYRFVPSFVQQKLKGATDGERVKINTLLNDFTIAVQKRQRENGRSFVSRTTLNPMVHNQQAINVFRVVLANPLTTESILDSIIDEQQELGHQFGYFMDKLRHLCK
jgi:glutamate decarboxylase